MPGQTFQPYRRLLTHPEPVDRFASRVTHAAGDENPRGDYILYWAQSARRLHSNLGLDYAIEQGNALGLPVVVYEALRTDYPSANDRIHTFVLEGVARNRADAEARGLRYVFFLPRTSHEARGVVQRLAQRARMVVTDDYPVFIVRAQTARFAEKTGVALKLVDGNGIVPMRAFAKEQYSAKQLRDRAHRMFPEYWSRFDDIVPRVAPYRGELACDDWRGDVAEAVASCAIDHSIKAVPTTGGREAGLARLDDFDVRGYAEGRSKHPSHTSGLSPYLHFGHLSIHEIAARVLLGDAPAEDADDFLEEAIIRRELSFNYCFFNPRHDSLASLPEWAKNSFDQHRNDRRKPLYTSEQLEKAETYDDVWNLAQRQLTECGAMHGYLRMLWGKKTIEWTATPEDAHAWLIAQHEKFALDGRDPNTYAGVAWCFGKHDRPWAPQRPIFGAVRYMSSASTARKVRLAEVESLLDACAEARGERRTLLSHLSKPRSERNRK